MFAVQFGAQFARVKLPSLVPDFMNTIIELEPADFGTYSNVQEMKEVFKIVYDMVRRIAIQALLTLNSSVYIYSTVR